MSFSLSSKENIIFVQAGVAKKVPLDGLIEGVRNVSAVTLVYVESESNNGGIAHSKETRTVSTNGDFPADVWVNLLKDTGSNVTAVGTVFAHLRSGDTKKLDPFRLEVTCSFNPEDKLSNEKVIPSTNDNRSAQEKMEDLLRTGMTVHRRAIQSDMNAIETIVAEIAKEKDIYRNALSQENKFREERVCSAEKLEVMYCRLFEQLSELGTSEGKLFNITDVLFEQLDEHKMTRDSFS